MLLYLFVASAALSISLRLLNQFAYRYINRRIRESQRWGLNICAGKTDGGGINADIKKYIVLPNFFLLKDIYRLPFRDGEFESVLCAHTMEHVDDPDAFLRELHRVGKQVVIVLPPLWDIAAALNIFEHKWIFFTLRTKHTALPPKKHLPFAAFVHEHFGQVYRA